MSGTSEVRIEEVEEPAPAAPGAPSNGLRDAAGRELHAGDLVAYAKDGFAMCFGKVVEVQDTLDTRAAMLRWRFRVRVQGVDRSQKRAQRPAWLEHIHGRLLRLEPSQVPEEVARLLGAQERKRPTLADLEREQQGLLRRLTEIDAEMERLPGTDESHITEAEVYRP